MLPEARALLEQVERCERLFQTPRLEVELAATHTLGNYYLPPLLAAFRARHPAARVRLDVVRPLANSLDAPAQVVASAMRM